jgi:hypothetical protein
VSEQEESWQADGDQVKVREGVTLEEAFMNDPKEHLRTRVPAPATILSMRVKARGVTGILTDWVAWSRRSRANKALFLASTLLALFVTAVFIGATLYPAPGDTARYLALYWVWGLCAIGVILGMAEYKTSPLRKGRERGHLFLLLYIGGLLIVTRALNMFLYYGPYHLP